MSCIAPAETVDVLIGLRKVSSQDQHLGDDVSTVFVTISGISFGLVPGGTFIRIDALSTAIKTFKYLGLSYVNIFSKSRTVMAISYPIHSIRGRCTAASEVIGLHRGRLPPSMSKDGELRNTRMAILKLITIKGASFWLQMRASPTFASGLRYLEAGKRVVFVNAAWKKACSQDQIDQHYMCVERGSDGP